MPRVSEDAALTAGRIMGIGSHSRKHHMVTSGRLLTAALCLARERGGKHTDCSSSGEWREKMCQLAPWNVVKKLEAMTLIRSQHNG